MPGQLGWPPGIDPSTIEPFTPPVTDYDVWYDASDTASVLTEGGAVVQWNDKSGNGYHVCAAAGATARPGYAVGREINRVICPDFDGSADRLDGSLITFSQAVYSVCGVIQPDDVSSFQALVAATNTNAPQLTIAASVAGTVQHLREGTGDVATLNGKLLQVGVPSAVGVSFAQVSGDDRALMAMDNTFERGLINDAGNSNQDRAIRFGARSNLTNFYNGMMAEWVIYRRELEWYEMELTMAYLTEKWHTA
jgi:hypothetical protein